MSNRVGGIIELKVDGSRYSAKGNFTYNIGRNKKEGIAGADTTHGYKEMPQVPFIEGEITDRNTLNLSRFLGIDNATVMLRLANRKVIVLRQAWNASEGTGNTEEGNMPVRFEGMSAEEIG